jgi:ABC-2 type transport system permease protein
VAELTPGQKVPASEFRIPASTQLLAVAWLRWRIFVNSTFNRRSGTKRRAAGLVGGILLRIIVWPFMALLVVGPVAGSGFLAWAAIARNRPQNLLSLLAGIALLWQFISINGLSISASVSSFDPASLVRYPLRFGRYLVLRTMLGLMTPSTVVGCLALLSAAIGIGIAKPALTLPALLVMAVYALMNIFLTRMIGAWMERWLANRRFREIFGMLMAAFAIGVQILNLQRAPMHAHGVPNSWLARLVLGQSSTLRWLPPGFAANAILRASHPFDALMQFAALLAITALFLAIFAIRLRKQFLGEYLSDGAPRRTSHSAAPRAKPPVQQASAIVARPGERPRATMPPVLAACLRKEWLTFRGNTTQFIGLITPLVFIVILNRGPIAQHPAYFLPGAIAYVLLGMVAALYNIFGADGLGVQIYLLAPVRLRDVVVAKNLAGLTLIVIEAGLAWMLVSILSRTPIPLSSQVSTALWTIFVIATNLALGTLRSIQAPRKFVPGQTRQRRGTPTNRTSSLLILVVMFGSLILQVPVVYLGRYFHMPWLGTMIFGPLAVAAVITYAFLLRNVEQLILTHRDVLSEELCKV